MPVKLYTLVFVKREDEILLGFKKRGFGEGKWNGFGGKVEQDEAIETAARRELLEESNLTASNLEKKGILHFEFVGDPVIMEVHVFLTTEYNGEPQESDEMRPKWFNIQSLPYEDMWADDKEWFPILLKGNRFQGYFLFEELDTIIERKLKEISNFA